MVYITIKYNIEEFFLICDIKIQFRFKQVHKMLAGQKVCWAGKEIMVIVFWSEMTKRTDRSYMNVIFEPVGIQPTEFESETC